MTPLLRRYFDCEHLLQIDLDRLRQGGAPAVAISHPDCVARAWVEFQGHGFRFASDASESAEEVEAFIFIARGCDGEPADLVAWTPLTGQIGSWQGEVAVLGEENLNFYRLGAAPLAIFANPLGWLLHRRHGVVIIDPLDAADIVAWARTVEVDDQALGFRLHKMFAPPRISIANRRRAA